MAVNTEPAPSQTTKRQDCVVGVSWNLRAGQVMVILWCAALDKLYLLTHSPFYLVKTT